MPHRINTAGLAASPLPFEPGAPPSFPVTRAHEIATTRRTVARNDEWVPVDRPEAPPDEYEPGVRSILFTVLLVLDLVVLGLELVGQTIIGLTTVFGDANVSYAPATTGEIWALQSFNFVLIGLIPLLWVLATRRVPVAGTLRYLGLTRWGHAAFVGVGLAGFMVAGVLLMTGALELLPESVQAAIGEQAEADDSYFALYQSLTWPLIVFVALTAGIGEEILFRGILQRWVGLWGQAVLFVMAHMANAFPLQWAVAFAVAVVFGYLRRAGWSLVTLIVAHAVYDLVLLAFVLILS